MPALLEAIHIKRKSVFEFEGAPYLCLDSDISTPTARGGQTLVRLKMRNLLTQAVFDKTFKAGDRFPEPDLEYVPATFLYADPSGAFFLNGETYETLSLPEDMLGDALSYLIDGTALQLYMYNGNPIGVVLPQFVDLEVTETEPAVRGDTSSGSVTKAATVQTGRIVRVPLFIKEGETIRIATETGDFNGRA